MIILKIIVWVVVSFVVALLVYVWLIPKVMFFYYGVRMWLMSLQYKGELKQDLKNAANEFFKFTFNWKMLPEQDEEARKDKHLKLLAKLLAYETQEEFQASINAVEEVIVEGDFGKNFGTIQVKMVPAEEEDKPFEIGHNICYYIKGPFVRVMDKKDHIYHLQIFTNNPDDSIDPKYFQPGVLWFTHPLSQPPSEQ